MQNIQRFYFCAPHSVNQYVVSKLDFIFVDPCGMEEELRDRKEGKRAWGYGMESGGKGGLGTSCLKSWVCHLRTV